MCLNQQFPIITLIGSDQQRMWNHLYQKESGATFACKYRTSGRFLHDTTHISYKPSYDDSTRGTLNPIGLCLALKSNRHLIFEPQFFTYPDRFTSKKTFLKVWGLYPPALPLNKQIHHHKSSNPRWYQRWEKACFVLAPKLSAERWQHQRADSHVTW